MRRLRLTYSGLVQGIGMRPFLARLASRHRLTGFCRNTGGGIEIEIQGPPLALEAFGVDLVSQLPAPGRISHSEERIIPPLTHEMSFQITSSEQLGDPSINTPLPDLAPCSDCLKELFDPGNRRFGYPFTHCTQCGPRYTILDRAPFDRERTAMKDFPLCDPCRSEYLNDENRRFHSQTTCCPGCGPHYQLSDSSGRKISSQGRAVDEAKQAILDGRLLAIQGVGGFHLCCRVDATASLERIRRLKARPSKPLALLFPSAETIEAWATVGEVERRILTSVAAPIVLLRKSEPTPFSKFAEAVAPQIGLLGCMLPSSPLQNLLMAGENLPWVVTSCNWGDEPICTEVEEVLKRLKGRIDGILHHNRALYHSAEDSLVRVISNQPTVFRSGRGLSPFVLDLEPSNNSGHSSPPCALIGLGGHLKTSLAVGSLRSGKILSLPHHGTLDTLESIESYQKKAESILALNPRSSHFISDLHPDYATTQLAHQLADPLEKPSQVQHHLAHAYSCLAEHHQALLLKLQAGEKLLCVAWDGTGYGLDESGQETLWGGEFFLMTHHESHQGTQRVTSLLPFALPGGTAAIREPRRSLLGLLTLCEGLDLRSLEVIRSLFGEDELRILTQMIQSRIHSTVNTPFSAPPLNTPLTSSIGRVFDGVAALLGRAKVNEYEGQAAIQLEDLAWKENQPFEPLEPFPFELRREGNSFWRVDWRPMVHEIVKQRVGETPLSQIALGFHRTLAQIILEVALRQQCTTVLLSGGCFQNKLLTEWTVQLLNRNGITPYWNHQVPPGDGGLAVGQVTEAMFAQSSIHNKGG